MKRKKNKSWPLIPASARLSSLALLSGEKPFGLQVEDHLHHLLSQVFGPLFTWQNPQLARAKNLRELTDILAIVGDIGYCFESKAITSDLENSPDDTIRRNVSKAIDKAKGQLSGAVRALNNPRLGNVYGSPEEQITQINKIRRWRALIVLTTQNDLLSKATLQIHVTSSLAIHYLSIQDLIRCLTLFDTPADFDGYISFRERFYEIKGMIRPREADLIAFYALCRYFKEDWEAAIDDFLLKYAKSVERGDVVIVDFAESLYIDRKRELKKAIKERQQYRLVDHLIVRCAEEPLEPMVDTPLAVALTKNESAILDPIRSKKFVSRALIQLDRQLRVYIGRSMESAMKLARTKGTAYFSFRGATDAAWFFFWGNQLTQDSELLFQLGTVNAKYGLKSDLISGVGFFGPTFDESQFRLFVYKDRWEYNRVMQEAWDKNLFFRQSDIKAVTFKGLRVKEDGKFTGPPASANRPQ